jgi:vacuolar iron transporter family protein
MRQSWRTGVNFGVTSGVITTLGLVVGLHAGTHSNLAVIGGILTIAVADALSDALGIHVAEESREILSPREIWMATLATFASKLIVALTFLLPVLLLPLARAVMVSALWGLGLLAALSYRLARSRNERPLLVIGEHVGIALAVIVVTHMLGTWVAKVFS